MFDNYFRRWKRNDDVSIGLSYTERAALAGQVWRWGTGFKTLTAAHYYTLNFTTPVSNIVLYTFASIAKSGDEMQVSLHQGGTYVKGTAVAVTEYNMNLNVPTLSGIPMLLGDDVATGTTITGGQVFTDSLLPGSGLGASRTAASASSSGYIVLKPATNYTIKFYSVGALTFAANIDLLIVTNQEGEYR